MLFNSIEYLLFLPTVFLFYWLLNNKLKAQNILLLAASYFFYGLWDYRFLSLIIISSLTDFFIGNGVYNAKSRVLKRRLLYLSLFINLGFLLVFKYHNFFIDSFISLISIFDYKPNIDTLNIILPVGISFYTFQTLSYSIDIFKGNLKPTKNIINFFTFVSFFPQLVAGPIERASVLLPQIEKKRYFNYDKSISGLRQILWGLFKKVVVADNCATFVDTIYSNYLELNGLILFLGGFLFMIQVYCDFSGYSDIAIGTAKLFGIDLIQNFKTPYFSVNTTDFWRRWHISLSTWFRDYIFIPLSIKYRNLKRFKAYIATFVTFLLIGIWHGDNWTFVVFGLLQAIVLSIEIATTKRRKRFRKKGRYITLYYSISWFLTMFFWFIGLIVFRSETVGNSLSYIHNMLYIEDKNLESIFLQLRLDMNNLKQLMVFITIVFIIEWFNRELNHGLEKISKYIVVRYSLYLSLSLLILEYFYGENTFIYFQF